MFDSHSSLLVEFAPLVVHQPIEQGPGHGAVRVEGDLPSPKAGICAQHKRLGFLTARDRAEQPPGLACRQASGPTPRVCATQLQSHLIQHMACARGHKWAERGGQRRFEPVGSVRPTEDERKWPNHRGSLHDRKDREIHRESAFRWNETKKKTALRTASRRNETKNKTVLRTSSENRHGKRCRRWLSTNAHNWLRFPARQHLGTRPSTRGLLASLSSSQEQDRETNGLISAPETRTRSAAHQTIALWRTRQRDKRSHQRAGNKDAERCSPND